VTDFAFATCLPGLEPAVKREVARTRPELRFAYSRPGLLTFKAPGPIEPADLPGSVFARVWGKSLGAARDPADAAHRLGYLGISRLHVFPRDAEADLAPWERAIVEQVGVPVGLAEPGDVVADVIVAAGEPAWLGLHRHDDTHVAGPGGAIPVDVPSDAPSRAYAKVLEAIAWAELPVGAGQIALEIGAAPGGAALALARRGLEVYAVDPGDVVADPAIHHLRTKVGALRWEQLPPRVDWLLLDVNLAPQVALHEVARLIPPLRDQLRGAILTLKLNEWSFVDELPALIARIAGFGLPRVRVRHLPSNRREVCAVATA
jgi:23S rRNA (cytidine2498-2'-O)-methyltransferase